MSHANVPGNTITFEEELLRFLARQPKRVPIPIFLLAALIWGMAVQQLPPLLPSAWLCLVLFVLILRWAIQGKLSEFTEISSEKRLKIAVILSAISGVTHGLSLSFFPVLPDFERAVQSMLLFALSAGAVGTTAGYMPVFLAYIIPTLVPLSLLWAISASSSNAWWIEAAIALLIIFLGVILVALARDAFRFFKESFDIRLQQIELNFKLQTALSDAEAANHAKTRFLASASHDLRQPMHTLSVFAAALALRQLDERSREIVKYMNEALEDLSSELDSLLDISKLDAGVIKAQLKMLALKPFLDHLYETFLPAAQAKHLDFKVSCADNLFTKTDKSLFERVVRNLLENAIKYTNAGHVHLLAETEGNAIIVTIMDTGPGIQEAEQERIFEEFYQIDNPERDRKRGLGLGLAIVKRLINLLEIDMKLVSSLSSGSSFILRLPRLDGGQGRTNLQSGIGHSSLLGLHVLVVDDETIVRLAMKELLESLGCRVSDVESTVQAIILAKADPPDIILADFRLRGTDNGIATVQAIRERYPLMPALLISGDTAPERLREADTVNIPLLHKPVTGAALTGSIATAVGRNRKEIS